MGWARKGVSFSGMTVGVVASLWGREAWQVDGIWVIKTCDSSSTSVGYLASILPQLLLRADSSPGGGQGRCL